MIASLCTFSGLALFLFVSLSLHGKVLPQPSLNPVKIPGFFFQFPDILASEPNVVFFVF